MTSACIRIEGKGPVATACALFLLDQGFAPDELILEPMPVDLPEWLGSRALALSLGSLELLLPVLPALTPGRLTTGSYLAAPIEEVAIMRAGALGRSLMEARQSTQACLGAVIRYRTLHSLLREALAARLDRAGHAGLAHLPDDALVPRSDGVTIVADGDIQSAQVRDFDQHALIAEVTVSGGHPRRAWERFTAEGPLAILPLPGGAGERRALVWCAPGETTERRCQMDEASFNRALLEAFGPALGVIAVQGPRFGGPVQRRARHPRIDRLSVTIGNAAQTLHPVAGQGLNLGLRDAWVLARCLADARARISTGGLTVGQPSVPPDRVDSSSWPGALDRYVRLRQPDRHALIGITDGLAHFTRSPALRGIESAGLGLMEMIPPLKDLARRVFTHGFRRL